MLSRCAGHSHLGRAASTEQSLEVASEPGKVLGREEDAKGPLKRTDENAGLVASTSVEQRNKMIMWNGRNIGQTPGMSPGSLAPPGFLRSQRDCKYGWNYN